LSSSSELREKKRTFADRGDMPTFGSNNASVWSYTEKDPFDCSSTSNPPAPNEADVKALLQLLSCRVDDEEPINEPSVPYERLEVRSRPGSSSEDADERAVGTHNTSTTGGEFLHFPYHGDANDVSTNLLRPEGAVKDGGNSCTQSSTCRHAGSSSSNTLTGSSSASSHTEQPVSTPSSTTRLSPSHPVRHNTAVSNALANIGSGLAEENFNVLTPDKRMMLSIPAEYIQTTLGSRNYRHRNRDKLLFSFCLCKTFCSGATCHHGADCDFIHCHPEKLRLVQNAAESNGANADPVSVHSFQVHWSTPVNSLAEATYPRLPSGYVVHLKGGEGVSGNTPQALPSEMVYATVGGQEALRLPSSVPLRICKHYEREKCARGALCHFIHPVVLNKTAGAAAATTTGNAAALRGTKEAAVQARSRTTAAPTTSVPTSFPKLKQQQVAVTPATIAPPPPQQPTTGLQSTPLLTAAQLPSGALVRYGEALFVWVPELQQLVPLRTTSASSSSALPTAGQPLSLTMNIDYQRGPNGMPAMPAGFRMPASAMLVQSSSAVASYPAYNPCNNPFFATPCNAANFNVPNIANPVYSSMLFPC
jgi:hypothetical protein